MILPSEIIKTFPRDKTERWSDQSHHWNSIWADLSWSTATLFNEKAMVDGSTNWNVGGAVLRRSSEPIETCNLCDAYTHQLFLFCCVTISEVNITVMPSVQNENVVSLRSCQKIIIVIYFTCWWYGPFVTFETSRPNTVFYLKCVRVALGVKGWRGVFGKADFGSEGKRSEPEASLTSAESKEESSVPMESPEPVCEGGQPGLICASFNQDTT